MIFPFVCIRDMLVRHRSLCAFAQIHIPADALWPCGLNPDISMSTGDFHNEPSCSVPPRETGVVEVWSAGCVSWTLFIGIAAN